MSRQYIGSIDQGTTSSRFIVFAKDGSIVASTNKEHKQLYPKPGWVEHDPKEIWETVQEVVGATLAKADLTADSLAAVGITNQRETTVVWNKRTGEPLYNAIVWQDQRTAHMCKELEGGEGKDRFRNTTGLPLSPYFAGTKIRWILDNVDGAREAAEAGDAVFGTIDAWLVWNLTGGARGGVHSTDVTNASRTLLMDIDACAWDPGMCAAIGVPEAMLPPIRASSERVGVCGAGPLAGVPLSGVLGDQQAALFGQACFRPGEAKNTYGTGCFLLSNTGPRVHSTHGLLTTVAYQRAGQRPVYALEGGVAVAGALVQWLRDSLGLIESAPDVEALAKTVPDNGDVYFVPAFSGLFAPHWRGDARGTIVGLTGFANKGHIARAVLEATAYQTRELVDAMAADSGTRVTTLKVDGGMIGNETLMQFQADVLGSPVVRGAVSETTALGAAFAAGLAEGFWADLDEVRATWRQQTEWAPAMAEEERERLFARWNKAVTKSLDWAEE